MWVLLSWTIKSYFIGHFVSFDCQKVYENPFSTVLEVTTLRNKYFFLTIKMKKKKKRKSYRFRAFLKVEKNGYLWYSTHKPQSENLQWGLASWSVSYTLCMHIPCLTAMTLWSLVPSAQVPAVDLNSISFWVSILLAAESFFTALLKPEKASWLGGRLR